MKFAVEQAMKVQSGEKTCSSTLSLASALDGGGLLTPRPGRFTRGERRYPLLTAQEAGWSPGQVWTGAENLAFTGIRTPARPLRSE